jgi:hypothetical protein
MECEKLGLGNANEIDKLIQVKKLRILVLIP